MIVLLPGLILFAALGPLDRSPAQNVHFGEDQFDKTFFSGMTQLEARQICEEGLQKALAVTVFSTNLTKEEQEKLRTAGRLDVHRFFARYEAAKRDIPFGDVRRDKWQQVSSNAHGSVRELSRGFLMGMHGRESLLEKSLVAMLTTEELARVKAAKNAAARKQYAEQIDTAMLVIARQASLSRVERQAVKEKLLSDTEPPAVFGTSLMPLYFVLAKMGEIEEDLRGMLTEQQWRVLVKLIQAGRTATR